MLYLIEFLHQTTTFLKSIAPSCRCILLNFYIKPQRATVSGGGSTVVSYWISTSNHNVVRHRQSPFVVVSYWISTSNHNYLARLFVARAVVSYWISTSNHNEDLARRSSEALYLIEFLHQTTTYEVEMYWQLELYLIEFLHQTTTREPEIFSLRKLYLIEFLHQTTTVW